MERGSNLRTYSVNEPIRWMIGTCNNFSSRFSKILPEECIESFEGLPPVLFNDRSFLVTAPYIPGADRFDRFRIIISKSAVLSYLAVSGGGISWFLTSRL